VSTTHTRTALSSQTVSCVLAGLAPGLC
jgi:hypothetical protein